LYELLSGREPFEGTSFGMLFSNIVSKEPAPLLSVRPDVPAGLAEIVHRCLKKNRDDRYANVTELVSALAAFASPSGAAVAKGIVARPAQRPATSATQRKGGGTMMMGPRPSGRGPAPGPGQASLPTPPPFSPVISQVPPAPARGSMPSAPLYVATPGQPLHPASVLPSAPKVQPSRNMVVLVVALVLFSLSVLGIVLYAVRAHG
jgi:serine/threonine-protein kinase